MLTGPGNANDADKKNGAHYYMYKGGVPASKNNPNYVAKYRQAA
jgi:hypothetical protein